MRKLIWFLLIPSLCSASQFQVFQTANGNGGQVVFTSTASNSSQIQIADGQLTFPPIIFDTSTTSSQAGSAGATCSWSMTVGNGNNAANKIAILACASGTTPPATLTAATLGGQAFTAQQQTYQPAQNEGIEIWYLVNPPTGAQTVSITTNHGSCGLATNAVQCVVSDYTGVSQTTPIDISTGAIAASGATLSATATLPNATDMIVDSAFLNTNAQTISVGSGQTVLMNIQNNTQGMDQAGSYLGPLSSGGSKTYTWTASGAGAAWTYGWVALKQAP
jgi:hypothetical protein